MTMGKLRAVSIALLLGTATLGLDSLAGHSYVIGTAEAASVRSVVGKPLQQAQDLAAKGDYKGALAAVNQADSAANKTADETKIIDQMRNYVMAKSGNAAVYEQQNASESPAISHTGGRWCRCLGLGPLAGHGSVGTEAGGPRE